MYFAAGGKQKTDPHTRIHTQTTKGAASNCHLHVANCGNNVEAACRFLLRKCVYKYD